MKKTANGADFEIVFVSSDRDEKSFNDYYGEMPWTALPFADREKKQEVSSKFKVQGIPTLIFLDASTGEVKNNNGREIVSNDPEGNNFPWTPKSFQEVCVSYQKYLLIFESCRIDYTGREMTDFLLDTVLPTVDPAAIC